MFKTFGWLVRLLCLGICLALSLSANASYVRLASSSGGGSSTYTFSGEQSFSDSWGMYYSAGETRTASSGEITRAYELGANYLNEKWVNVSLGAEYDKQELGEVVGSAPVVTLSRKWYYGSASTAKKNQKKKASIKADLDLDEDSEDSEEEEQVFEPYFSLSLSYKQKDYSQKPPRSTGKEFKVQQNYTSLSFSINPKEQWGMNLYYSNYEYDQDIPNFYRLVNLPATKVIRGANLTEGLASTLSGFYDHDYGIGFTYYISALSSLDLTHSRSYAMVDSTWDVTNGLSFTSGFLENWSYNVAVSSSKNETSTNPTIYGDFYISYFF